MKKILVLTLVILLVCLTLAGCECRHRYEETFTTKAYCTFVGLKKYTCTLCGASYTEELPMIGHSYTDAVTKEPTCIETGIRTFTCTMCQDAYTEDIPTVAHTLSEAAVTKAPSCTEEGQKVSDCAVCGATGMTESIPKTDHAYTAEVTKKPTCTATGSKTLTCPDCGDSYSEALKATGHSWAAADCTRAKRCTKCGSTEGSPLGHDYSGNQPCSRCGHGATVTLQSTADTYSYYVGGEIASTCRLSSASVSLDSAGNGGLLYKISYGGSCTYNSGGQPIRIGYKVYDSEGSMVHQGSLQAASVAEGQSFQSSQTIPFPLTPGKAYTIVLCDDT